MPTPSSLTSGARSYTRQAMPRLCRFSASDRPAMPPPTMAISLSDAVIGVPTLTRRALRHVTNESGRDKPGHPAGNAGTKRSAAALGVHVEQHRLACVQLVHAALERILQLGRILDALAIAAAGFRDLLEGRRRVEVLDRHVVRLRRRAVR